MRVRCLAAALLALAPLAAGAETLRPAPDPLTVGKPLVDEDGDPSEDVSGIACAPLRAGKPLRCLVVADEGRSVQTVKIGDGRIEGGRLIRLIGKGSAEATHGVPPEANACPKPAKKADGAGEFDGEGVAYADGAYYVVGSHGCGRHSGRFNPTSLRLARLPAAESGKVEDEAVETTFRLGEALARAGTVGPFHLKSLDAAENGLNVEGVAVLGGRLYAGLRAPSLGGRAFLVSVGIEALFRPGSAPLAEAPQVTPLAVGDGAGIRDLAALDDRRLLVLTGPAQGQAVPYRLWSVDPAAGATLKDLGTLPDLRGDERAGKAEAVAVIGRDRVLVLYDGLPGGGPRVYEVPLGP